MCAVPAVVRATGAGVVGEWRKLGEHRVLIELAFRGRVLTPLESDDTETLDPTERRVIRAVEGRKTRETKNAHISTVQAILEHARYATQHVQTLRREREYLLRGLRRRVDRGRRPAPARRAASTREVEALETEWLELQERLEDAAA